MLGFSPLASAPLAADSDRVRADLEARLAGAINLSGSAHANASVRSEGAAVLDLAAISSGFSANSAAINGASNVSGSASAKVKLNSSASDERQPSWPVPTTTLAGGAGQKTGMPVWRAAPLA